MGGACCGGLGVRYGESGRRNVGARAELPLASMDEASGQEFRSEASLKLTTFILNNK